MKNTKLLLLALFTLLFAFGVNAQDDFEKKPRKKGINPTDYIGKHSLRRYAGFEVGLNSYWTSFGALELAEDAQFLDLNVGRSWVFKYNFLEKGYNLGSQKVRFITGLGIETNIYRFENGINLVNSGNEIGYTDINLTGTTKIVKNNLKVSYLTLPLMFDFNTKPGTKSNFHIAVGAEIGLRIGTRTRTVQETHDHEYDARVRNNFHTNLLKPSAMVRVGFGSYTLFANYSLMPLFKDNTAPVDLTPVQIGLRVVPL